MISMGRIVGRPKFQRIVKGMNLEEEGYVFPSALSFDETGKAWLDLYAPFYGSKPTSGALRIKRTGVGKADYEVHVRGVSHRWSPYKINWDDVREGNLVGLGSIAIPESKKLEYQNEKKTEER